MKQIHEGGRPFSIEFCKLDKVRGTAGELMTIATGILSAPTNRGKGQRHKDVPAPATGRKTSPAHAINNTINIFNCTERNAKKRIVKVHIRLITQFNGRDVA